MHRSVQNILKTVFSCFASHLPTLLILLAIPSAASPAVDASPQGPWVALSGLTCSSGTLTGAVTDACTVTLTGAAGGNGLTVSLSSSNSTVAVPGSVTVPSGASSAGFAATASAVTTPQTVILTASTHWETVSYALQLTAYSAPAAISFVQVAAAVPQTATSTVSVGYPGAQTLGNMNIVVVGWNDTTATVQSVTDSAGNKYSLAVGPTSGTALQQSIYYAPNIAGGSNAVTVTFSQAAANPDIRILEYGGVNTLDVTAGARGTGASASSGSATTTNVNELIFGADTVATLTEAAGSGFMPRIITSPDGDLAEDLITPAAGSNAASATLNSSAPWVMQMATFEAMTAPVPTSSLGISPTSLIFGSAADGASTTLPVTLTSIGTDPVTIYAASIFGSGYTFNGVTFPVTLNPQLAITLEVTFAPTNIGSDPGTLTIISNSSSNPTAMVSLSGTGQSSSYEVDLTWDAPTNSTDQVVGYNIYRATGGSSSYQVLNTSANTSTAYTDTTVQDGTAYTYYAVSVDAQGNQSVPSVEWSVTIP